MEKTSPTSYDRDGCGHITAVSKRLHGCCCNDSLSIGGGYLFHISIMICELIKLYFKLYLFVHIYICSLCKGIHGFYFNLCLVVCTHDCNYSKVYFAITCVLVKNPETILRESYVVYK